MSTWGKLAGSGTRATVFEAMPWAKSACQTHSTAPYFAPFQFQTTALDPICGALEINDL